MEHELIQNIDLLHTTELGAQRVKRNLGLEVEDMVAWCKQIILQADDNAIMRKGKNWYVSVEGAVITVNAKSYTILTAHKPREQPVQLRETAETPDQAIASFTQEDLQEALRAIQSTIGKCEKALPKLSVGKSQHTLTVRRIRALQIAVALISRELEDVPRKRTP